MIQLDFQPPLACAIEVLAIQEHKEHVKQAIRRRIQAALRAAQTLPPDRSVSEIRARLAAIQQYCQTVNKTFIVVEEEITCDQFDLGGDRQDTATLFRGPSESASVAICVTCKGSLLHRNDCPWLVYRDAGDVHPA